MRRSHRVPERWPVKRRWLVVLEATTYTKIYGQQQLGKCWCVVIGKIFVVKLYSRKIFLYVFCQYKKIFLQRKKANCGQPNVI